MLLTPKSAEWEWVPGPGRKGINALLVNDDFVLMTAATRPYWREDRIGALGGSRKAQ
jgi:hypothetical protein